MAGAPPLRHRRAWTCAVRCRNACHRVVTHGHAQYCKRIEADGGGKAASLRQPLLPSFAGNQRETDGDRKLCQDTQPLHQLWKNMFFSIGASVRAKISTTKNLWHCASSSNPWAPRIKTWKDMLDGVGSGRAVARSECEGAGVPPVTPKRPEVPKARTSPAGSLCMDLLGEF